MKELIFVTFFILNFSVTSYANESNRPELGAVLNRLSEFMTKEEREVVGSIKLSIPNNFSFKETKAFIDKSSHQKTIQISEGTLVRHELLARAIAYSAATGYKNHGFLSGYIRYLSYNSSHLVFTDLLTPEDYAEKYGLKLRAQITVNDKQINNMANATYLNMAAFIVAHEVAHHVLQHSENFNIPNKEKRDREYSADAWAIKILKKSGFKQFSSVFSMLMFNELTGKSLSQEEYSSHPAPVKRALKIANNFEGENNFVSAMKRNLALRIERQRKADENAQYWIQLAEKGNRYAQLKVGRFYATGDRGYPYNISKAVDWYKLAADNKNKFDYLDQADAEYRLGYMYAFHEGVKRDYKEAEKYLKRSANKNLYLGKWHLDKLYEIRNEVMP